MLGRVQNSRRKASRTRSRSPTAGRRSTTRRASAPARRSTSGSSRSSRAPRRSRTRSRSRRSSGTRSRSHRSSRARSGTHRAPGDSQRRSSPRRRPTRSLSRPRRSMRRVSALRTRSASGRGSRRRRTSYRRSGSSPSMGSSSLSPPRTRGSFQMQDILQRIGEVERFNSKIKKKDEDDFTFSKKGCERQFKFNNKVKDITIDRMKVELSKHFRTLSSKIDDLIKEGNFEMLSRLNKLDFCGRFKASALWADAFYKSKCPSACPSVRPSVCVFTFEVPFKRLFAPTSKSRISNIFRDL